MLNIKKYPIEKIFRELLKYLARRTLFLIISLSVILFLKLLWAYSFTETLSLQKANKISEDILYRKNYLLRKVITEDFGPKYFFSELGSRYQGEWALGTLSMLSLTLTNIGMLNPESKEEALASLRILIKKAMSDDFTSFDSKSWYKNPLQDLKSKEGHIAYLGHLNLMLAEFKILGGGLEFDDIHQKITNTIIMRSDLSPCGVSESYPGEAYSMDNIAAVSSIALAAKSLKKAYYAEWSKKWLKTFLNRFSDSQTSLPAFSINYDTCKIEHPPSGVSGIWNSLFSWYIYPDLGKKLYKTSIEEWNSSRFGFHGINKYHDNYGFVGDIDNGPLFFGLSLAATGFALGPTRLAADYDLYNNFLRTIEFFGSSFTYGNERFYLAMPIIGDAILLAMRTSIDFDKKASPH
ncbi:MAG: hypothetical protein ACXWRE_15040 [Pseudobdellovibrionaceae bacterium]